MFTYTNGYWEVYRRFQGDFFWFGGRELRGGVTWEDLSMVELLMGEETFNGGAQDFLALENSEERPGLIVIETLKNETLKSIVTSKELLVYVDSKYISFIKFSFTYLKLRA